MALIKGQNNRWYDTATGKRVDKVEHPELRSRDQIIAARVAAMPKQPRGGATENQFETTIQIELQRHPHIWAKSDEGKRVLGNLRRASAEWEANQKAQREQAEFQASIADLVAHAENQAQIVFDSPEFTQEEVEQAEAALAAVKATGDRQAYAVWEKSLHDKLLNKLAGEAAEFDQQARKAAERRDEILRSGLDFTPVPEVRAPEPVSSIPTSTTHVAVVNDRGQTKIIRRDEI